MSNVSKLGVRPKVEDPASRPTLVPDENSNHPVYNNANNEKIAMQANRLSEMTEENDAFYVEEIFEISCCLVNRMKARTRSQQFLQQIFCNYKRLHLTLKKDQLEKLKNFAKRPNKFKIY